LVVVAMEQQQPQRVLLVVTQYLAVLQQAVAVEALDTQLLERLVAQAVAVVVLTQLVAQEALVFLDKEIQAVMV
jgi:hypothetical protein